MAAARSAVRFPNVSSPEKEDRYEEGNRPKHEVHLEGAKEATRGTGTARLQQRIFVWIKYVVQHDISFEVPTVSVSSAPPMLSRCIR